MYQAEGGILYCMVAVVIMFIINLKRKPLSDNLILTTFYTYLALVVGVTLFPLPVDKDIIRRLAEFTLENNYIPFVSIYRFYTSAPVYVWTRQLLGNIIMVMPFGFLLGVISKKGITFKSVLIRTMIFSLSIEIAQILLGAILGGRYKVTDIDDIILNTIGGVLGYLIFKLVMPLILKYIPLETRAL
jgi:glycopeptide antibiotics resistance protein